MASLLKQEDTIRIQNIVIGEARKAAPRHIAPHIFAEIRTRKDGGYSIKWEVDSSPDGPTPDARAREYGSGVHATIGRAGKYVILPKNKKVLAFRWDKANRGNLQGNILNRIEAAKGTGTRMQQIRMDGSKFYDFGEGGKLQFNWVEHPGVEAANGGKGYLGYGFSIAETRVKEEILKSAKEGLGREIYKSLRFGRKNK